ncbi:MAG: fumarate hydratase [Candidatus Omnitrophica bacterium]|nr:fumarate hydratase [Candidatus Omnitrophota bacterium]MBU1928567.1 fumarate hydratase [Candidatus Omnitrophota bacterium]MBU2034580.1 fumarate hydratase [Candidatus Omnitrophota bacterium]
MKIISAEKIKNTVADLCLRANLVLRKDVLAALKLAYKNETDKRAGKILDAIIKNAAAAEKEKLAICQDTGLPCVFLELGQDVKIKGDLNKAINKGVELGYKKGSFRNSIIKDPLIRGKSGYLPALIYVDLAPGNKLKLTVLPKGFGCENKTQLKMFLPTTEITDIRKFILDAVKTAGPDACPPYVVGVGIGGSADYACLLAKKALLRSLRASPAGRLQANVVKLERDLFKEINRLNIGPMGLGGKTTCLAVNIETYPTHIAGLPVAVNISCHALRSSSVIL